MFLALVLRNRTRTNTQISAIGALSGTTTEPKTSIFRPRSAPVLAQGDRLVHSSRSRRQGREVEEGECKAGSGNNKLPLVVLDFVESLEIRVFNKKCEITSISG